MQSYYVVLLIILPATAVALGIFYLIRQMKKEDNMLDYVWIGEGDHPFKKKREVKGLRVK